MLYAATLPVRSIVDCRIDQKVHISHSHDCNHKHCIISHLVAGSFGVYQSISITQSAHSLLISVSYLLNAKNAITIVPLLTLVG